MSVFGITLYGTSVYGYFIPPIYRIDPFVAEPVSYSQINISWTKPSGTIEGYRLIRNSYGWPVDQDDGEVLLDITSGWLGSNYADTDVTGGNYYYYGFYVLINSATDEWVRSGLTGCLMINNYGSSSEMESLIPSFYITSILGQNELVLNPVGNSYLNSFLAVLGWGFDYLRTQYDTYLNINNPWTVPLNQLYNMASQFNLNINPDISAYTLRKALYYNANINQLRGTPGGIATELSALTGWNADITTGPNIMLSNDQSMFEDPVFQLWSANITYNVGEYVQFGNYWYQCLVSAYGSAQEPTGTSSSNTWWKAITTTQNTSFLNNTVTGNIDTWEALYPGYSNGVPTTVPATAAPAFIASYPSAPAPSNYWNNTASPLSQNVTVSANDLLIILGGTSDSYAFLDTPYGGNLNYNALQQISANSYCAGYAWSTQSNSGQTFFLSETAENLTQSAFNYEFGFFYTTEQLYWGDIVLQFSHNNGVGNTSSITGSGAPTLTLSTSAHSAVAVIVFDHNSVSGSSRTWRTVNGTTPTSGNGYELSYSLVPSSLGVEKGYGVYVAYYPDTGSAGSTTVGLSAPTGMKYTIVAVEILGVIGSPGNYTDYELLGVADPLNASVHAFNALGASNLAASPEDIYLRSVSRTPADIGNTAIEGYAQFAPDKYQAMGDGVPLPYLPYNSAWFPTVTYSPQEIVTYSNQPFVALRQSLNSVPPYASIGTDTQDWAPLSFDDRVRLCISAYTSASSAVEVIPFVEWYDAGGNYISRLIARNQTPGSVVNPNQFAYDSFVVGAGNTLTSRTTNDGGNTWTQQTGSFSVSPFADGCAYPTTAGTRSISTVNTGNANAQVGLTFVTEPLSGQSIGLILRWSSNSNYLRAGMTQLVEVNAGVLSVLGTYSTPFQPADRILVTLNGSTITVYRNNVSVLTVTSAFNSSATVFGIVSESILGAGGSDIIVPAMGAFVSFPAISFAADYGSSILPSSAKFSSAFPAVNVSVPANINITVTTSHFTTSYPAVSVNMGGSGIYSATYTSTY